jgi:peptidoglycan/xylan/chitin deacetylase (PgdA/CDA1 family)
VTFDDGPSADRTPAVLDTLARHGATATFFVLLTKVEQHPGLVHEIVQQGHEVALHGPDHRPIVDFPYTEAVRRTIAARSALEAIVRRPVRWFRPPYGTQSATSALAVRRAGLTSVLWSATTWDWKAVTHDERIQKALEGGSPGAILLSHDGTADEGDGAPGSVDVGCDTAALLDEVLVEYRQRGLSVGSVGDAMATGRPVRSLRFLLPRRPFTDRA